jgi:pimeloyl-ACP methyl ester carboxylesterase
MARFLGVVLTVAVVGYLGAGWYFSSQLITQERRPLALTEQDLPEGIEPMSFVSDGLEIEGWYIPGTGSCGILYLHGRGMNREQPLDWRVPFASFDCHEVLIDHRAHGASAGEFQTYGVKERADATVALEWLRRRADLEPGQIGVVGISYGAATALQMLPTNQDLAFVLADSPFADLRSVAEYQAVEQFGDLVLYLVEPAAIIAGLRARFDVDDAAPVDAVVGNEVPVLVVHDRGDPYTPFANSAAIDAADPDDPLVLVPFEGDDQHHQMIRTQTERYGRVVSDFLAAYAPGFGT